jgi:hypothetical protein
MSDVAYQKYVSPYRVGNKVIDARSHLGFTSYGGSRDEPAKVVPYSDGLIRNLRKLYTFRDEVAVQDFLYKNPFLIQVLRRAHRKIRKIFGTTPRLVLRIVPDPEGEGEGELFLFIQTERHPQVARALLDELLRTWWLDAMLDAKGEMSISLEYV